MAKVKVSQLGLGDVVDLGLTVYSFATVCKVEDNGWVHLHRPYIQTADFSYTGGVITYIGQENFSLSPDGEIELARKGMPLR